MARGGQPQRVEALGRAVLALVQHRRTGRQPRSGLPGTLPALRSGNRNRIVPLASARRRALPSFRPTLDVPDRGAEVRHPDQEIAMKLFKCQACGQVLYFENTHCERCSRQLGYSAKMATLSALEPENGSWRTFATPRRPVHFCDNAAHDV